MKLVGEKLALYLEHEYDTEFQNARVKVAVYAKEAYDMKIDEFFRQAFAFVPICMALAAMRWLVELIPVS